MEDKDLEYVLQVLVLHGLIEVLNLRPEDMGVGVTSFAEIEKKFNKLIWRRILKWNKIVVFFPLMDIEHGLDIIGQYCTWGLGIRELLRQTRNQACWEAAKKSILKQL